MDDMSEERRLDERRKGPRDRRTNARGGRRATDFVMAGVILGSLAGVAPAGAAPPSAPARNGRRATDPVLPAAPRALPAPSATRALPPAVLPAMRFGTDIDAIGSRSIRDLPFSYGVFWAGPWNQKLGWDRIADELAQARKKGVVPVVNWWYWGDEISPQALQNGVRDKRHGVQKDMRTWLDLSRRLASMMRPAAGGEAIVVLETEFNKNGVDKYLPFDAALAQVAGIFHAQGVKVVLGFGSWGQSSWANFSGAIAASDYLGIQLLRSSVRDSASYLQAVDTLVGAARHIQRAFGKPAMVIDLALSSYPDQRFEVHQAAVMAELFARLSELKQAGVRGIIWRQIQDDPGFDTSNYHGMAERYWGLLRADGSAKPAFAAFLEGVKGEAARRTASS